MLWHWQSVGPHAQPTMGCPACSRLGSGFERVSCVCDLWDRPRARLLERCKASPSGQERGWTSLSSLLCNQVPSPPQGLLDEVTSPPLPPKPTLSQPLVGAPRGTGGCYITHYPPAKSCLICASVGEQGCPAYQPSVDYQELISLLGDKRLSAEGFGDSRRNG